MVIIHVNDLLLLIFLQRFSLVCLLTWSFLGKAMNWEGVEDPDFGARR